MPNCQYCGKEFSAKGLRLHEVHCKTKNQEPLVQGLSSTQKTMQEQIEENPNTGTKAWDKSREEQMIDNAKVKEVKLHTEEEKTPITPGAGKPKVEWNTCAECGQIMKGKPKFCYGCGCEFDHD